MISSLYFRTHMNVGLEEVPEEWIDDKDDDDGGDDDDDDDDDDIALEPHTPSPSLSTFQPFQNERRSLTLFRFMCNVNEVYCVL